MLILVILVALSSLVFAGREINCSLDDCNGLVGYWKLNELGGKVNDSSDYGNNGTVTGATHGVKGKIGKALSFDGSGDFVEVPTSSSLETNKNLTISVWFNTTSSDTYEGLASKANYSGHPNYHGYNIILGVFLVYSQSGNEFI